MHLVYQAIKMDKLLEDDGKSLRTDGDLDLRALARRTPGYVGADLAALIRVRC